MKQYFQPLAILYLASALLVSGYLFINPPLSTQEFESGFDASQAKKSLPKGHRFKETKVFGERKDSVTVREVYRLITYNDNSYKYSLLGFSVGGLVLYALILFIKAKNKPK
jgi:hypothetical protein